MKIKAILFDLDGVLVDAKEWHYEALNKSLEINNIAPITREDHLLVYDGLPTKCKLEKYPHTADLSKEQHNEINNLKQEITFDIINEKCKPSPVHLRTFNKLKEEHFKIACCSNSTRSSLDMMLEKVELNSFMEFTLSNQDVSNSKPDPEIYLKAIKKLELLPKEVLICEDNIRGVRAGLLSGAYVLEIGVIEDVNYENIKKAIAQIESAELDNQLLRPEIRKAKVSEMIKGWFVGDFYPSILQSKLFEAGVKEYKKGDRELNHMHKIATEITVVVRGKVVMCNRIIRSGEMILMEPGVSTSFEALEDTITFVVKTPSVIDDKYQINSGVINGR